MAVSPFLSQGEAPLSGINLWREQARDALDAATWDYLEAGAGEGWTTASAAEAWQRIALRPRILRGVIRADAGVTVLGERLDLPVMTAPNGRATLYCADGELALLAGTEGAGTIAVLPSSVVPSLAALVAGRPRPRFWQQLYMASDRGAMRARLDAIRAAGCRAIVLTVDLMPGPARSLPPRPRPAWERDDPLAAMESCFMAATIDDLAWLCGKAGLPVVVKGVLRGDDAALCIAAGAAALIVSNHGGNQLDTVISSAEALAEVVAASQDRAEVYVDGGIRSGVSVLKALALGARAVLVGRPVSYSLAAAGATGVAAMLGALKDELERAMALCGVATLDEVDPSLVRSARP